MSDQSMLTPQEVLELLRALQTRIPDFVLLSRDELRKIRRAGYDVDRQLARKAVDMAGQSTVVQTVIDRTPEELAGVQEDTELWQEVEGLLRLLVRGVSGGNAIRRKRLARMVQRAVRISATLAEQEDHHHLAVHVEVARDIRKRKRGK